MQKSMLFYFGGEFFIESKQITHIYTCTNEEILHFALYFYQKMFQAQERCMQMHVLDSAVLCCAM